MDRWNRLEKAETDPYYNIFIHSVDGLFFPRFGHSHLLPCLDHLLGRDPGVHCWVSHSL